MNTEVEVYMTSEILHKEKETYRRFYKGKKRINLRKEMDNEYPSVKNVITSPG